MQPEKIFVVDLRLSKKLMLLHFAALVIVALLVSFAIRQDSASAEEMAVTSTDGMRQFYLSTMYRAGDAALNGCSYGYHMASIWELADPSNLKYNTTLGYVRVDGDSGWGPPTVYRGWVRTGYSSYHLSTAGQANCDVWSTDDSQSFGTVAILPDSWTSNTDDVGVWAVAADTCGNWRPVWCIED